MNVKDLKQLLADAPDDMPVMVIIENHLKPGMFGFTTACECETGIIELGPTENGEGGGEAVFLIAPHGAGVSESDSEEGNEAIPELN